MNNGLFDQPLIESVKTLFNNSFSIPVFQRPYSWTKDEINELFTDLLDYFNNRSSEDLFMGTVYLAMNRKIKSSIFEYSIIDGQQRITTLSLVCLLLYHYANVYGVAGDSAVINLEDFLWKKTDGRLKDKNEPLLNSGSIEKDVMKHVFDTVFEYWNKKECEDNEEEEEIKDLFEKLDSYNFKNKLEQRVIENLKIVNKNILEKVLFSKNDDENKDRLLSFIDFISDNLKFITIIVVKDNIKKLFEIFESINSKGKQLDQIDLIKTYIFQNIDYDDYDTYLKVWGELIEKTQDNLNDYMYVFLRSFIKFYRVGLSAKYFRGLNVELISYYKKNNLSSALKALLDDMNAKVSYYNMMFDKSNFILNQRKFKFYTTCIQLLEYQHPSPLIFRAYCEYSKKNITAEQLTSVVKACFSFMFSFLTISNRDSKDAITVFENIMNKIFSDGFNDQDIINLFKDYMMIKGINEEQIKNNILSFNGYNEKSEKISSRILLTAYEFSSENSIDYDKGLYILNNRGAIQIDHILPQDSKKDDNRCYYYCEDDGKNRVLKLKKGHDFVNIGVNKNMDYDMFVNQVLNKMGNLKLLWRDDNLRKSNNIVALPEYSTFNTYKQISTRANQIANNLKNNEIFKVE